MNRSNSRNPSRSVRQTDFFSGNSNNPQNTDVDYFLIKRIFMSELTEDSENYLIQIGNITVSIADKYIQIGIADNFSEDETAKNEAILYGEAVQRVIQQGNPTPLVTEVIAEKDDFLSATRRSTNIRPER
jgi:hypothetical protein